MQRILIIGIGGFIGAIMRYAVSGWVQSWSGSVQFPYGTLAVNGIGCLLIGFLSYLAETRGFITPELRSFLVVGILGAFTTFSTFSNETVNLLRDSENLLSLMNVAAHLLIGLSAVWIGRQVAFLIWR